MSWFQKKSYPDYWLKYTSAFNTKPKHFEDIRFVVFDTETTGLNTKEDKILSIGAVAVKNHKITIKDGLECYLQQDRFKKETVEIHGIRKSEINKISENEALKSFLQYVSNSVLVAHHASFDVQMINGILFKNKLPKLKNLVIDTGNLFLRSGIADSHKTHYGLDEIANKLNIPLHDRHNAAGDAFITAQVFVKLLRMLEKNNTLSLSFLTKPAKRRGLL